MTTVPATVAATALMMHRQPAGGGGRRPLTVHVTNTIVQHRWSDESITITISPLVQHR